MQTAGAGDQTTNHMSHTSGTGVVSQVLIWRGTDLKRGHGSQPVTFWIPRKWKTVIVVTLTCIGHPLQRYCDDSHDVVDFTSSFESTFLTCQNLNFAHFHVTPPTAVSVVATKSAHFLMYVRLGDSCYNSQSASNKHPPTHATLVLMQTNPPS